jgi:hypothetical protein
MPRNADVMALCDAVERSDTSLLVLSLSIA